MHSLKQVLNKRGNRIKFGSKRIDKTPSTLELPFTNLKHLHRFSFNLLSETKIVLIANSKSRPFLGFDVRQMETYHILFITAKIHRKPPHLLLQKRDSNYHLQFSVQQHFLPLHQTCWKLWKNNLHQGQSVIETQKQQTKAKVNYPNLYAIMHNHLWYLTSYVSKWRWKWQRQLKSYGTHSFI